MFAYHGLRRHHVSYFHYREFVFDSDLEDAATADPRDQEEARQGHGDSDRAEEASDEDHVHRTMTDYEARLPPGDPQRQSEEEEEEDFTHRPLSRSSLDSSQLTARRSVAPQLEARRVVHRLAVLHDERRRSWRGRSSQLLNEGMASNDLPGRARSRSRSRVSSAT